MNTITDSDDYTTDEGKRKRGDTEEIFKKSKKLSKSPIKVVQSKEDIMTQMMGLLTTTDVKKIKQNQAECGKDVNALYEEIKQLRKEQNEYKKEVNILREENEQVKKEVEQLRQKITISKGIIEKTESEKKKKKHCYTRISLTYGKTANLREKMVSFIGEKLKVAVTVSGTRKLSEKV
ncbi:unnamed protein product [Acanthoscelides obtectus]|uniref:Uncharacterized protein n=1 Tax=Acanthoscelides obtectus TaxID=200917 RepID=A0A9P0PUC0_ACAOB|nr:unnamed protein product [Acanthoscelides obtectus]CAK1624279.1 hypothetical protein AOBTE_LOCUS2465 [Acanthoscelides obtectus]